MRMRQAAAVVLALAALSCFPGSAGAKVGHGRPPAKQWIDIELEGSNGYSIHISVNPRRHLILLVSKEGFSAEYMTRDVLADTDRVKAKLLGLGTISVRFSPAWAGSSPLGSRLQKAANGAAGGGPRDDQIRWRAGIHASKGA
ncbi:MAG TPA: hypothetical protein VIS51_11985 [Solirubrobacterales bacterium]